MRSNTMIRYGIATMAVAIGVTALQSPATAADRGDGRSGKEAAQKDTRPTKADYRRLIDRMPLAEQERQHADELLARADRADFRAPGFQTLGYDLATAEADPSCRAGAFQVYRRSGVVQAQELVGPVYLDITRAWEVPGVDATLNPADAAPAYPPGTRGPVRRTVERSKDFWSTDLSNVQVRPMDSRAMLPENKARMRAAFAVIQGEITADYYTDAVREVLDSEPAWNHGDHDMFTVTTVTGNQASTDGTSMMAVGIGALNALEYARTGKAGVREYVAAEMARTIQVRERLVIGTTTPEDSRRAAMMSDAFAGYYLAHRKGAALGRTGLADAAKAAAARGDCLVTSAQHTGTPAQRRRAFRWGVDLAKRSGDRVAPAQRLALQYDVAEVDLL